MRERALDEDVARRGLRRDEAVEPALVAAGAVAHGRLGEVGNATAAGRELRVGERVHLGLEALGQGDVVAVHACDQPPARL